MWGQGYPPDPEDERRRHEFEKTGNAQKTGTPIHGLPPLHLEVDIPLKKL
jgi:hypothetical protein